MPFPLLLVGALIGGVLGIVNAGLQANARHAELKADAATAKAESEEYAAQRDAATEARGIQRAQFAQEREVLEYRQGREEATARSIRGASGIRLTGSGRALEQEVTTQFGQELDAQQMRADAADQAATERIRQIGYAEETAGARSEAITEYLGSSRYKTESFFSVLTAGVSGAISGASTVQGFRAPSSAQVGPVQVDLVSSGQGIGAGVSAGAGAGVGK